MEDKIPKPWHGALHPGYRHRKPGRKPRPPLTETRHVVSVEVVGIFKVVLLRDGAIVTYIKSGKRLPYSKQWKQVVLKARQWAFHQAPRDRKLKPEE